MGSSKQDNNGFLSNTVDESGTSTTDTTSSSSSNTDSTKIGQVHTTAGSAQGIQANHHLIASLSNQGLLNQKKNDAQIAAISDVLTQNSISPEQALAMVAGLTGKANNTLLSSLVSSNQGAVGGAGGFGNSTATLLKNMQAQFLAGEVAGNQATAATGLLNSGNQALSSAANAINSQQVNPELAALLQALGIDVAQKTASSSIDKFQSSTSQQAQSQSNTTSASTKTTNVEGSGNLPNYQIN